MDNHTPSPQYAIGAEREVIGALFNLGGDVDFVENIFTKITDPSFFSDGVTRQTYEVASELFKAGKIINESTLSDILFDQGSQDLYVSLTDIIDKTTGSYIEALMHVEAVVEAKNKRDALDRIKNGFSKIANSNGQFSSDLDTVIDDLTDFRRLSGRGDLFEFMTFSELGKLPNKEWLQFPIFGLNDTAMIFAESGAGKSFVLIDWCIQASTGTEWAGFKFARPLRVAYTTNEGQSGIRSRFYEAATVSEADLDILEDNLLIELSTPQLFSDELGKTTGDFIVELKAKLRGRELDVIAIDTVQNASAGADLSNADDWGIVHHNINKIKEAFNCNVFLSHHKNKNEGQYYGSAFIKANMDAMIELKTTLARSEIHFEKTKDEERPHSIQFAIERGNQSGYVVYGDVAAATVAKDGERLTEDESVLIRELNSFVGDWRPASDLAVAVGMTRNKATKILSAMCSRGVGIEREAKDARSPAAPSNPYLYRTKVL